MCLSMTKTTTGNSLQQLSILLVLSVIGIMDMYLCYSCDKHIYMYSSNTWKYMYLQVYTCIMLSRVNVYREHKLSVDFDWEQVDKHDDKPGCQHTHAYMYMIYNVVHMRTYFACVG